MTVSFSMAHRKERKDTSTPTKPPPIWGGLTLLFEILRPLCLKGLHHSFSNHLSLLHKFFTDGAEPQVMAEILLKKTKKNVFSFGFLLV